MGIELLLLLLLLWMCSSSCHLRVAKDTYMVADSTKTRQNHQRIGNDPLADRYWERSGFSTLVNMWAFSVILRYHC